MNRILPKIPNYNEKMRVLIDSDTANEIDDLYAIALAVKRPDRFQIEGFVATHFASSGGIDGTERSFVVLQELLAAAGKNSEYIIKKGGHPMQYPQTPSISEGAEFIIQKAKEGDENNPLWVIGLGAATNLASAILLDPSIVSKVRYVFHSRCEYLWPERTVQFNVYGDILAAKTILESNVPLVWFDTGTHICASCEETAEKLMPLGGLGYYLHTYRSKNEYFMQPDKGFFDLGDIAFLLEPSLCKTETIPAPALTRWMYFDHDTTFGHMLRAYDIDVTATWDLFYKSLKI